MNAWIQYKKHINRWFYWESTYYNNFQGNTGKRDLFVSAQTFGYYSTNDAVQGATGGNYGNGDGVMFYPGTDTLFPSNSYGVDGPFASLRLKQWRRGLQDCDYLTLAAQVDSNAVQNIVTGIVPKVVWEVGVADTNDPTWVYANISWSTDPDVWEAARSNLVQILMTPDSYGIPAWWKIQYFGATNGTNTAALEDWDGDGMNNLAEYQAGTCPTNAQSLLRIADWRMDQTPGFAMGWTSVAGKYYTIRSTTNLLLGFPDFISSNIVAAPMTNNCVVPIDQADRRFYRVIVN